MQAPAFGSSDTLTWEAPDPRADGRRRGISLSRSLIVIARKREGVAMRITMRPNMFRGVLLRLGSGDDGVVYEVKFVHADPDLSITLASMTDAAEAERAWKAWARFVGARALVERVEGELRRGSPRPYVPGNIRAAAGAGAGARRPRFLVRRKTGRRELMAVVEKTRELFGGWRVEG